MSSHTAGAASSEEAQQCPPAEEPQMSRFRAWLFRPRPSLTGPVRAWMAVIRLRPTILLIPVLFFAVAVALGVWGVVHAADQEASSQQAATQAFGESVARSVASTMANLYMPVQALASAVTAAPQWNTTLERFAPFAVALLDTAKTNVDGSLLGLWPQGVATTVAPLPPGPPPPGPAADIFEPPTQQMKDAFLHFLSTASVGDVYLTGPLYVPISPTAGIYYGAAFVPVFVANVSESETFGIPGYNGSVKCSMCYNSTSRSKFWGVVSNSISLNGVFAQAQQTLASRNYRYSLINPKPFDGAEKMLWVSKVFSSDVPPSDGVSIEIAFDQSGANDWLLTLSPEDGYSPSWKTPLIAVVVIVSFVLAVLLHLLLLSRYKHRLLLEAILPPKVIDRMHSGIDTYLNNMGQYTTTGSPADKILSVTEELLEGKQPSLRDVVLIRTAIKESANIYSPLDLTDNIKAALDDDVAQSLLMQLQIQHRDLSKFSPQRLRESASCELEEDPRFLDVQQGLVALLDLGRPDTSDDTSSATQLDSAMRKSGPAAAPISSESQGGNRRSPAHTPGGSGTCSQQEGVRQSNSRYPARTMMPADGGSRESIVQIALQQDYGGASLPVGAYHAVPRFPIEEVEAVLAGSWEWQFDVFKLNDVTGGRPLSALGFYAMHHTGLVKRFNINSAKLARFLRATEAQYNANPYHNAAHAAGVLHCMHVMMHRGGLAPSYADPLTHMACLLAAIVHDLDHTGRTNDFLVSISDDLALRYNDKAPQENHHLAMAFALLKRPDLNFLSNVSTKERTELRRLVIELVLATDMKVHFQLVSHFGMLHRLGEGASYADSSVSSKMRPSIEHHSNAKDTDSRTAPMPVIPERPTPRASVPSVHAHTLTVPPTAQGHASNAGLAGKPGMQQHEAKQRVCTDETERLLSLQIALKCSDLAHMGAPLPAHLRWVSALEEEFFQQGDAERQANLPISPLFDREKPGVSRSQPGFYEFVVIPLYSSFVRAFPGVEPLHSSMMSNYQYWLAERTRGSNMAGEKATQ